TGGGVALGPAVQLDLLPQQRGHRAVAQRAVAELVAARQADRGRVAVGRAGVAAHRRADADLAVHVHVQAGVADLAVDPGALAVPAGEGAEGSVGLGEAAAVAAEVGIHAAVAGEAAGDQAVAVGPVHAEQRGRGDAVVQLAVAVALVVGTQAAPPAGAGRGLAADGGGDQVGPAAAGDRGRGRDDRV